MMTIAQIMEKMIAFSEGNIHDITHLSCVWTYAKNGSGYPADENSVWSVKMIQKHCFECGTALIEKDWKKRALCLIARNASNTGSRCTMWQSA